MNLQDTNSFCKHRFARPHLPAEHARIEAGFSLDEAARKLRLSPRYLRSIERNGNASLKTARRLARLYRCSGDVFLFKPAYFAASGHRAIPTLDATPTAGADTGNRASRRYQSPKSPTLTLIAGGDAA